MTAPVRVIAALVLASAVVACNGGTTTPLPPQSAMPQSTTAQSGLRHAIPFVPAIDIGRRAPRNRVSAVVLLRYNHQAELDRFVANLVTTPHAHYLTREEFIQKYALTAQQQQRAIDVLRANDFTIDKTYPNRTLLDVSAPTAAFERFFGTEMHDFAQGQYGTRYQNVTPINVPSEIAPLVKAVDARSVVAMHSDLIMMPARSIAQEQLLPAIVPPPHEFDDESVPASATNVVRNPGFETGHLRPWKTCDSSTTQNKATIQKVHPHSGRFDAYAGTYSGQSEPNGITSVCQALTIPNGATLTAYSWGVSNDRSTAVHQFGAIYNASSGELIKALYLSNKNSKGWKTHTINLSAYAGDKVLLAFGVVGKSAHRGKTIGQLVDDVSLSGTVGTPTPPPPATLPCPTPSTNPTPTPSFSQIDGWGPQSVQSGFCMPVNYGYDGTGQTAAIVIDKEVASTDLSSYLSTFKITRTGTVSYVLIDGAPAANDNEGEATLDLETIAALAPGANVIVYVTGDLSDQHIADAYQAALNDTHNPMVVNSSFGGCESITSSGTFDQTTNGLAQQGAAVGMTFSASSGDQGADCYNGSQTHFPFGVQGPASGTYFVGVGGTQSTVPYYTDYDICSSRSALPATIDNPVVWNDCVGSGGGGVSAEWPTPSYQSFTGAPHRVVPDIALPAAFDSICYQGPCDPIYPGGWAMIWGTSWSSPIYVAMQTEINQACHGPQWGITTLYSALATNGYKHFVDVTGGNNLWGSPYAGSAKHYNAAVGFDAVSGIGMPTGMFLATDRCNVPAVRSSGRSPR